jgi:hypothetical protein
MVKTKDKIKITNGVAGQLKGVLGIFFSLSTHLLFAQHDSLVFKNGDVMIGEIKSLDKGVLTIETSYSENDFTIEWSGIKEIYSVTRLLITFTDGSQINGTLRSEAGGKKIIVRNNEGGLTETTLDNIVYLKGLKSNFWGRMHGNIDLGLSVTKANHLVQYSVRSNASYLADRWVASIFYDDIRSTQDSVEATKRTETGASFTYILPKGWFTVVSLSTLSNTEQALDLRFTAKGGAGRYFVRTNKAYFSVGAGLSFNDETFTNGTAKRSSVEGYVGTKVNLFDIGDFSLLNDIFVYPSLTESGRWRVDFNLDTKYDLPHDFYVKFGITVNYDNRPAAVGKETDYVYVISLGWELN